MGVWYPSPLALCGSCKSGQTLTPKRAAAALLRLLLIAALPGSVTPDCRSQVTGVRWGYTVMCQRLADRARVSGPTRELRPMA
ncbi:hypothetical protein AAFF_G00039810 [Aldrovandia affinis]|uniref:Uncharacterized protein n=1 Tax=Aldrovandia affinis TaxID=143900 RepID=A0AAD7S348_9TELE|nr:hypothetical protein AAFF_G00039810 [Aldrovandia affinis]